MYNHCSWFHSLAIYYLKYTTASACDWKSIGFELGKLDWDDWWCILTWTTVGYHDTWDYCCLLAKWQLKHVKAMVSDCKWIGEGLIKLEWGGWCVQTDMDNDNNAHHLYSIRFVCIMVFQAVRSDCTLQIVHWSNIDTDGWHGCCDGYCHQVQSVFTTLALTFTYAEHSIESI